MQQLTIGVPLCYVQDGGTPLFVACQSNHQDVVEELLKHGADLHVQMVVDGASLVFVCAQNGHLQLLKYLLSKGAKTSLRRKVQRKREKERVQ